MSTFDLAVIAMNVADAQTSELLHVCQASIQCWHALIANADFHFTIPPVLNNVCCSSAVHAASGQLLTKGLKEGEQGLKGKAMSLTRGDREEGEEKQGVGLWQVGEGGQGQDTQDRYHLAGTSPQGCQNVFDN